MIGITYSSARRVMTPILQAPRALAVGVLCRSASLLREVALAVGDDAAHVVDIAVVVAIRIPVRVLLQNLYDLATAIIVPSPHAD